MKALVYQGRGRRSFEDKPRPAIKAPTDAIVKVTNPTVCGSDLHAMRGDAPRIARGRTLGSEGTGIVERVGDRVSNFRAGDSVLISGLTSCGTCVHCERGQPARCENGGWLLGCEIDGTCAEYVRVPFADYSLLSVAGAGSRDTDGPWIDNLPEGFVRNVIHGPDERIDTAPIVFGGSVGMGPLLTVMQYYRTVLRPSARSVRTSVSGHPESRKPALRNNRRGLRQHLLHYFAPTRTR
ncbi:MAG TPA: alcohol dehydrogenase catalytic domain-containing protein [Candidatus Krumholzibacteria bacterium]|nr:alcohol dehydrogenase catalytic domain-containing protein [Candidatus Krumholzibacteria bacterium]